MNIHPQFAFTWGREPIDIRFGVMVGSQYDFVLLPEETAPKRCLRFDLSVGLVWVCVRAGVIVHA